MSNHQSASEGRSRQPLTAGHQQPLKSDIDNFFQPTTLTTSRGKRQHQHHFNLFQQLLREFVIHINSLLFHLYFRFNLVNFNFSNQNYFNYIDFKLNTSYPTTSPASLRQLSTSTHISLITHSQHSSDRCEKRSVSAAIIT